MSDPTISEKMKDLNKTLKPKEEKMETQADLNNLIAFSAIFGCY